MNGNTGGKEEGRKEGSKEWKKGGRKEGRNLKIGTAGPKDWDRRSQRLGPRRRRGHEVGTPVPNFGESPQYVPSILDIHVYVPNILDIHVLLLAVPIFGTCGRPPLALVRGASGRGREADFQTGGTRAHRV